MKEKDISEKCKKLIPPDMQEIMHEVGKAASQSGEECYAVGGIVRDCGTGVNPKDVDLVCSDAEKVIKSIQKNRDEHNQDQVKVSPLTNQLTRIVNIDGKEVDFAQARKETYSGSKIKPETIEKSTIEEDVMRRDFTINTLMLDLTDDNFMNVVDLTGRGIADLENRVLDTPRDPDVTFKDDPSRMLRLARFMKCKGFTPTQNVLESAKRNASEIHRVPWEKFNDELLKGAACPSYFRALDELDLLGEIIPEVAEMKGVKQPTTHHRYDVYEHTMQVVDNVPPQLKLAALLHDVGKVSLIKQEGHTKGHETLSAQMTKEILKRLKFSNEDILKVARIVEHHMDGLQLANDLKKGKVTDRAIRRFIQKNEDILEDLHAFSIADSIGTGINVDEKVQEVEDLYSKINSFRQEGIKKVEAIAITGNDVMQVLGLQPGKEVGNILKEIKQKVIDGELENDYDVLFVELQKYKLE